MINEVTSISIRKSLKKCSHQLNINGNLSIDFWGTLCTLKKPSEFVRLQVCKSIISRYELSCSSKDLLVLYNRISQGLRKLNMQISGEGEYSASDSWNLVGRLILKNHSKVVDFQNYAMKMELCFFSKYSYVSKCVKKWFLEEKNHRKSIIISDFEHDSEFLNKIFLSHGCQWHGRIITSSELNLSKYSAGIFQKLNLVNWLHIGDNRHSDYFIPKSYQISTILVRRNSLAFFSELYEKMLKVIRLVYRVRIIFTKPATNKSQLRFFIKLLYLWKIKIIETIDNNCVLAFIGSEGAFASQMLNEKELFYGDKSESICLNFGRSNILKALIATNHQYVLAKLILENWELQDITKYFNVSKNEISSKESVLKYFEKMKIEARQIKKAQENIERLTQIFPDKDRKIVIIDIGYQATFADCLQALGYTNVKIVQLLGKHSTRGCFKGNQFFGLRVRELQENIKDFSLDADLFEGIFASGPRSPKVNHFIEKLRNDVLSNIRETMPVKNIHISKKQFSRHVLFPTQKLYDSLLKVEYKIDELNSQEKHFQNLPWKLSIYLKFIPWHYNLVINYAMRNSMKIKEN